MHYKVNFDDEYNSYDDFGLILTNFKADSPTPKRNMVDVPGYNGQLDLSWYPLRFENRQITLEFALRQDVTDWLEYSSLIMNALHGTKRKIYLDTDFDWYWYGVVTVDEADIDIHKGTVKMVCDAAPFKFRDHVIETTTSASGTTLYIESSREIVYPTIATTAAITVQVNSGTSVALSAGTHKNMAIYFSECMNEMTITGAADVTITYTEGSL